MRGVGGLPFNSKVQPTAVVQLDVNTDPSHRFAEVDAGIEVTSSHPGYFGRPLRGASCGRGRA